MCLCVRVHSRACMYPYLSSMQIICAILWRHLWPLCFHYIFRHDLINGAIFEKKKKVTEQKSMFWLSLQCSSKTFLILRRILRDVKNVKTSSCKVPVILVGFYWNVSFLNLFSKKYSSINFHLNPPSGSRVAPYGQTDTYEANSSFWQFCESA